MVFPIISLKVRPHGVAGQNIHGKPITEGQRGEVSSKTIFVRPMVENNQVHGGQKPLGHSAEKEGVSRKETPQLLAAGMAPGFQIKENNMGNERQLPLMMDDGKRALAELMRDDKAWVGAEWNAAWEKLKKDLLQRQLVK